MSADCTPGPWKISFPYVVALDARETIVCEVTGAATNIIAQADARLIAAAPDLLAALQVIASAPTVGGISAGERKGMERCAAIARAAIAKAEGR